MLKLSLMRAGGEIGETFLLVKISTYTVSGRSGGGGGGGGVEGRGRGRGDMTVHGYTYPRRQLITKYNVCCDDAD
jgi:hypothetical protein